MKRNAVRATRLLKIISSRPRLLILCQLADAERTAGELGVGTGLSQPAISQHLAKLRQGGLVATRRQAQQILYSLKSEETRRILLLLHDIYCSPGR